MNSGNKLSRPMRYSVLMDTMDLLRGRGRGAREISKVLRSNPVPTPDGFGAGSDKYYETVHMSSEGINQIREMLVDIESASLSSSGVPSAKASYVSSLLDDWTQRADNNTWDE